MSKENEGEEDKQKDDFSATEEFDFYFPFTKPLVLDLPTEEDRVLASAWVQKLEAEPETNEDKRERLNYLKLLLFVLQRGRLSGIFKKQPPSGSLEPFPQGFSIFDMANWMLEQDDTPTCGGGDAGHVPYTIEMSNDLREFVASQEIPNFGVQMYYAWSSDEFIDKWSLFDEEKFPQYILDKLKQLQEIRSDEKSTIVKNGCVVKKRGCNLTLPEKYSQKKVKSPQEIERSQGRSFHAYMGLVGRMGNFNDKCDDDPKKFQRQDQRKGKCPRRSDQKKCPGNGGEGEEEEEEEFDNTIPNLGGLDALNRSCLCPYPHHHPACPEHHSKGGPQPNTYEDQQNLDRSCGFRSDQDSSLWNSTVIKAVGPRRMREQCLENEMPSAMPTQKRTTSPRPRSSSPNRPNTECSPEDNSGEFPTRTGTYACSLPSCPCPCPRITPKMSVHKTPSASRTGGRGGVDLTRTFKKSSKQDSCFNENRAIGPYLTSFKAPETCPSSSRRPDLSPVGGRTNTSPSLRPVQPEIIHCYDSQNPDPALTKRVETNADWLQTVGGGNRYMTTDLKLACRRDQLIAAAQQNKCKMGARRELFSSPPQLSAAPNVGASCQPPSGTTRRSPQLESHPLCDYSPSEEASGVCPSNQQGLYPQQNYVECEDSEPPQTCYGMYETCGRQITDTYKQSGPQTTRVKNAPPYYPNSTFMVRKGTGRLANMTSVLQGIKQKTEAHREKCARLPANDVRPETGIYHSPQPLDANACPPGSLNKTYVGHEMPPQQCPLPDSPYPGYYPNRLINYQQDECDVGYEEEDECDSLESIETCPQGTLPKKTPAGAYGVNFTEADQCYDAKYITPDNTCVEQEKTLIAENFPSNFIQSDQATCGSRSPGRSLHFTTVKASGRECGYQKTSPDRTLQPESCLSNSTKEFKTMLGDSSFGSTQSQWISPRTLPTDGRMNEESEHFNLYQETDMRNCHPQTPTHGMTGNRYFDESFKARSGQPYHPVTSTPIHHYKRNFKDEGNDDLSPIRPPSSRCA